MGSAQLTSSPVFVRCFDGSHLKHFGEDEMGETEGTAQGKAENQVIARVVRVGPTRSA